MQFTLNRCCGLSRGSACSTLCLLSQREAFGSWANDPDPGGLREIEQCLGTVGPFSVCIHSECSWVLEALRLAEGKKHSQFGLYRT